MDTRTAQIIYQNALGHATKIVIHNSGGEGVDVEDVIAMAKVIAREVIKIGKKEA
jgi:hypothetical protein